MREVKVTLLIDSLFAVISMAGGKQSGMLFF